MSIEHQFGNKKINEPGSYSRTQSKIKNQTQSLSFGNVLVIDTGNIGESYGSGSGIDGYFNKNKKSIQSFDSLTSIRNKVRGGKLWQAALPLFQPEKIGTPGISKLFYIKAATTIPATINYAFNGGGANGGTLEIKCKNEGEAGNGALIGEVLAIAEAEVTNAGTAADSIAIKVDLDDNDYSTSNDELRTIGTYVVVAGNSKVETAVGAAAAINAATLTNGGFTATSSGSTLYIKSPIGTGAGANYYKVSFVITGATAAISTTNQFIGGIDNYLLYKGFGSIVEAGPNANSITPDKFVMKFYVGSYRGVDSLNQLPYDGIEAIDTETEVVAISDEFSNISELINWMNKSAKFNDSFGLTNSSILGSGLITNDDLVANVDFNLASGGSDVYSTTNLNAILDVIKELDYTFILADNFGTDSSTGSKSANNLKLLNHIVNFARFQKYLIVPAGFDENEYDFSIGVCEFYDSSRVIAVHSGVEFNKSDNTGVYKFSQFYTAAAVLGRICGLNPEIPVTFKKISADGMVHDLSDEQRITALKKGLLHLKYDTDLNGWIINQGINTNQKNKDFTNPDGTSYEISVERIGAQLNKELDVNAKVQLLGTENGPNRSSLTPETVKNWVIAFLQGKVATDTKSGPIVYFENVTATVDRDAIYYNYDFEPNFPVNKLFSTGSIIDRNIQQ